MLLFVPETRYVRDENQNVAAAAAAATAAEPAAPSASDEEKAAATAAVAGSEAAAVADSAGESTLSLPAAAAVPKKTWAQELSLWSGVLPGTSLLEMFARPFPMLLYPCVVYASWATPCRWC